MPGLLQGPCQIAETTHFRHFSFIGAKEPQINPAAGWEISPSFGEERGVAIGRNSPKPRLPMALDRITLSHFRNHAASRLDGSARVNLLVGENGAGKTNVLEALSLLAPGRGLRRAPFADVARADGPGSFSVSAALDCGDRREAVMLGTGTLAGRPGRRVVQVNGAEASALALAEWLAVGWLTPAMDGLFADGAAARRRDIGRLAVARDPLPPRPASRSGDR